MSLVRPILAAAVLSTIAATASAQSVPGACELAARTSHSIMLSHQKGVSLQRSMDSMTHDRTEAESRYGRSLIIRAYSEPRYSTEANQARAAAAFRDVIHVECLRLDATSSEFRRDVTDIGW